MSYLELDGNNIFYEVKGQGPRITILRGLSRSSAFWLGFDEILSKDFEVLTVDHRGLGKTSVEMKWTDSINDIASDIVKVWDSIGWESCHVFGLSLGGMVAMELAASFPSRVCSLVVANSSTRETGLYRVSPKALLRLVMGSVNDFHRCLLKLVTTDSFFEKNEQVYFPLWKAIIAEEGFPRETSLKQILAAARFKIEKRIDTTKVPTLVLSGASDQFVPPEHSKLIHKLIEGSSFLLVEEAGHEISMGRELEIESILKTWVQEC